MLPKQRVIGSFAIAIQCTESTRRDDGRNQFLSIPTSRTDALRDLKEALLAAGLQSEVQPLIARLEETKMISNRAQRLKAYQAIQSHLQTRVLA